jgi:hypothetical protein
LQETEESTTNDEKYEFISFRVSLVISFLKMSDWKRKNWLIPMKIVNPIKKNIMNCTMRDWPFVKSIQEEFSLL